mmetsp:Transcript_28969/g.53018  ORF Transcript_28969/g.53018 Transcript_28969/m.53018 type:complete len:82 (-) Transcript_28969:175-420(-)
MLQLCFVGKRNRLFRYAATVGDRIHTQGGESTEIPSSLLSSRGENTRLIFYGEFPRGGFENSSDQERSATVGILLRRCIVV